jgi:hypothetical protein
MRIARGLHELNQKEEERSSTDFCFLTEGGVVEGEGEEEERMVFISAAALGGLHKCCHTHHPLYQQPNVSYGNTYAT